jgi:hypothetical protein
LTSLRLPPCLTQLAVRFTVSARTTTLHREAKIISERANESLEAAEDDVSADAKARREGEDLDLTELTTAQVAAEADLGMTSAISPLILQKYQEGKQIVRPRSISFFCA